MIFDEDSMLQEKSEIDKAQDGAPDN